MFILPYRIIVFDFEQHMFDLKDPTHRYLYVNELL